VNYSFLNDATLWVGVSFILFVILIFKPLVNQFSQSLEKKIQDLKKNLDESKVLKEEAEKLYNEQLSKQKENSIIIKRIEEGTKKEIKDIKQNIEKEIELSMLRKIKNYDQISTQMENDLRENLKNEIMEKVTLYTEARIRKNLLDKHNNKFVKDSLKKIPKQLS